MPIELAIFDLAGTTLKDDRNVAQALKDALSAGGFDVDLELIRPLMGIPKPVAIRKLTGKSEISDDNVLTIHQDFVARMVNFYETDLEVGEIEGATEAFLSLQAKGIKVFVDTGFSREITDSILSRLEWHDLLDGSVTSDEVENGRPFPDLVYLAMRQAGVEEAKSVAKVGDTPSDLGEGTAAGCGMVIGVLCGTHTKAELEAHAHTHLAQTPLDAARLILEA